MNPIETVMTAGSRALNYTLKCENRYKNKRLTGSHKINQPNFLRGVIMKNVFYMENAKCVSGNV